ncbi:MAG: 6-phosphofructokinase [Opitutae bacterium]
MKTRIGILTGGGDCPGLNAVIRAVVIAAAQNGWTTYGFLVGFEGLLNPVRIRVLDPDDMDGLLFLGGTIPGTSNSGRFSAKVATVSPEQSIPESSLRPRAISIGSACVLSWWWAGSLTPSKQNGVRLAPLAA